MADSYSMRRWSLVLKFVSQQGVFLFAAGICRLHILLELTTSELPLDVFLHEGGISPVLTSLANVLAGMITVMSDESRYTMRKSLAPEKVPGR
jgi:hypothetical protein